MQIKKPASISFTRAIAVVAMLWGFLAAPAQAEEVRAGDLVITQAWSRATPGGATIGGGYLTIENKGSVADRLLGAGFDREVELGGEAHGPQHTHRILAIAGFRIADQLQPSRADVSRTADEIPNREILDVVVKAVGGEIPPPDVFLNRTVDVVAQNAARGVERAMNGGIDRARLGVHLAFGDPYGSQTGADWKSTTHVDVLTRECNVWIDNDQVIEKGKYLLEVLGF